MVPFPLKRIWGEKLGPVADPVLRSLLYFFPLWSALNDGIPIGYAVRTMARTTDTPTCTPQCALIRKASLERSRRKRKCTSDPVHASLKARNDQMSPGTMLQNTRNLSRQLHVVKNKLGRLVRKDEFTMPVQVDDNNTNFTPMIKEAFDHSGIDRYEERLF
jgi:hypothetical protein